MTWLRRVGLAAGGVLAILILFVLFMFFSSGAWRYTLLAHPERPLIKTNFPAIADWNTLEIRLARTPCHGTCPDYEIRVRGDGTVLYTGYSSVSIPGKHQTRIPVEAVRALVRKFQGAEFFWAFDISGALALDAPEARVSISFDGRHKEIIVGMPHPDLSVPAIDALPRAIDGAVGASRWARGKGDVVGLLRQEQLESLARADALLVVALRNADWAAAEQRLAALSGKSLLGCWVLAIAAGDGKLEIVNRLIAAGVPLHWKVSEDDRDASCDVLDWAVRSGAPDVVAAVLAQHPNVNVMTFDGGTPLIHALWLTRAKGDPELGEIVTMLLAAHARADIFDKNLQSPLVFIENSPMAAQALLANGQDDIRYLQDLSHQNALMKTHSPQVASYLIAHGARLPMNDRDIKAWLKGLRIASDADRAAAGRIKAWMAQHSLQP